MNTLTVYKTYRNHNCNRYHRTYQAWAKCCWPRTEWIHGEGPYALLTRCRVLCVSLWSTEEEALSQPVMTGAPCGGFCNQRHEVVRIKK